MTFEQLSNRYTIRITEYPLEWLTFLYLYDADIPLFPLQYFHVISPDLPKDHRPEYCDRAFGYIERTNFSTNGLDVVIVCNKDLNDPRNATYRIAVIDEIRGRLGVSNPVTYADVTAPFQPYTHPANLVLRQMWQRVVTGVLGNALPFGRIFDHVFGLGRCVASFYSPGGRKAEWIETHYYCCQFGEKIQTAPNFLKVDFYLLPTYQELINQTSCLQVFPKYQSLLAAANDFHQSYCTVNPILGGLQFSKFTNPFSGTLNTQKIIRAINQLNQPSIDPLTQCFNAFDKGPLRTVMFLQMLNDLVSKRLNPAQLTSNQFGIIYDRLKGFYQTPKVISFYAQQCFGNTSAIPFDTWIKTFMKWPMAIYPTRRVKVQIILANSTNLGKVERLLWVTAQARKIHSSLCNDALWCVKYDSTSNPRGANPFACNACLTSIRNVCPAYKLIANETISFNRPRVLNQFSIETSSRNNTTPNQRFVVCEGNGTYGPVHDDFSPVDMPSAFAPFPVTGHQGQNLTVDQFVRTY